MCGGDFYSALGASIARHSACGMDDVADQWGTAKQPVTRFYFNITAFKHILILRTVVYMDSVRIRIYCNGGNRNRTQTSMVSS